MLLLYRLLGVLYLASGLWCAFQVELAADYLGFNLLTDMGKSEFFSVYGGLQIGIGVAMLASSFKPDYLEACVYFSAIFSGFLALFRVCSFLLFDEVDAFAFMLLLEIFIAVALWGIWFTSRKINHSGMHQS